MSRYLEFSRGRLTIDTKLDRDNELCFDIESGDMSATLYLTIAELGQLRDLLNELPLEES